jgi:hypothetical protein
MASEDKIDLAALKKVWLDPAAYVGLSSPDWSSLTASGDDHGKARRIDRGERDRVRA